MDRFEVTERRPVLVNYTRLIRAIDAEGNPFLEEVPLEPVQYC